MSKPVDPERRFSSPPSKAGHGAAERVKPEIIEQDNYEVALRLAQEKWRLLDPFVQARRCGADASGSAGDAVVSLDFIYRPCRVTHPGGDASFEDGGAPAIWEQILILHYLCSQEPVPSSRKIIAYCEVPDGKFYDAAYQKRTKNYMLKVFGDRPELLLPAAASLGAEPAGLGDVSARVRAFPMIDLYLVLWRGDHEFPPDASLLLDERIRGFLDAEDIAVLGGMAVGIVAGAARDLRAHQGK